MTDNGKSLSILKVQLHLGEQRHAKFILSAAGVDRVESHRAHHIPCRHLSAVLVAANAVGGVAVHLLHYLHYILPCLLWLSNVVEQVCHMMARFVAVGILPNHSCTEYRQLGILGRGVGEHAVELLLKTPLAHEVNEPVDVVLHAPHIMPCVALADVWCVFVGVELRLELSFAVAWLHECSCRVVLVAPVAGAAVEHRGYAVVSHSLCHACNAVVVIGILQCARHCPVVGVVRVGNIVWYIAVLLVEAYAAVSVAVGGRNTGCKCLFGIKAAKPFQVGICNNRHGVVTNHHVCLASPHVPHRQAAVLLMECDERVYHVIDQFGCSVCEKWVRCAVCVPQRECRVVHPAVGGVVLLVGTTVLAVDIAKESGGNHGTVECCVEAYTLVVCAAFHLNARQPIVPMFLCRGAVKVEIVVRCLGGKVLCRALKPCARECRCDCEFPVTVKGKGHCNHARHNPYIAVAYDLY